MSHRAGIPYTAEQLTVEDMYDWSRMTSLLAAQKPQWEPGKAHGYHAHTIGFLGGELVRRVDPQHRSYGQFLRDELDSSFYVGIPDDAVEARVSPLMFYTVKQREEFYNFHLIKISYMATKSQKLSSILGECQ